MFISVACFGSINKAPKHLCYRYTTARTAYNAMHLTIHSRKRNINPPHLLLHDASFVSSAVTSAAVSDDTEIFSAQGGCAWGKRCNERLWGLPHNLSLYCFSSRNILDCLLSAVKYGNHFNWYYPKTEAPYKEMCGGKDNCPL